MARKPNMRRAVRRWSDVMVLITRTEVTDDFEPGHSLKKRKIKGNVQPAQKKRLNTDKINWSLKYRQLFTEERVNVDEYFLEGGVVFKIIDDGDWNLYGYTDAVGEEVKDGTLKPGDFTMPKDKD